MSRARVLDRARPTLAAAVLAVALVGSSLAQEPAAAYKIIVNAQNPVNSLRREQVASLFLNRHAAWANGPQGDAVDQSMTSKVREAFSTQVLGQSLLAVQNYWRKRLLEAREAPPLVKANDAEVIAAVGKSPGGIGYVASDAELPPTVKALKITEK